MLSTTTTTNERIKTVRIKSQCPPIMRKKADYVWAAPLAIAMEGYDKCPFPFATWTSLISE
ncbi:hypothetical protein SIO70_18225 [Chitinophaga sancti]|uniref:hypothetical protein n=1 Tax=Chitinophaga sancti TaxID=1004 RepID=UPI002A754B35|nr:hypothetical protein [Chitinophaga sancti]WPQ60284.1 hypothetical protein SIO70_18225 [Chitinophaga sancti]